MISKGQALLSEEQQRLVDLAEITFQSHSTAEIIDATQRVQRFMMENYPSCFNKLEQLITRKQQLSINTRKSLINLYKHSAESIKELLARQSLLSYSYLNSHKKALHLVEHALDNSKIEAPLKGPLISAYISMFVLFNPENHERLISKAKYYFNTHEDIIALGILQAYHQSKASLRYKAEFYKNCLGTLLHYLHQKLTKLTESGQYKQPGQNQKVHLERHMQVLHGIWTDLNFQRYESIFTNIFRTTNLVTVFQLLHRHQSDLSCSHFTFEIAQHIISSLTRCKLTNKFPAVAEVIRQLAQQQLAYCQHSTEHGIVFRNEEHGGMKLENARLKLLITCLDASFMLVPLIQPSLTIYDIFQTLVIPNYKEIKRYLDLNWGSLDEIDAFFDDFTLRKQSECYEVLVQKLILTLCQSRHQTHTLVKAFVSSFFFNYLPTVSNSKILPISSTYLDEFDSQLIQQATRLCQNVGQFMPDRDKMVMMLLFTASSAELFLPDIKFLGDLDTLMGALSDVFWQSEPEICFFSLLIYRSYKDDIFSGNNTMGFRMNIVDYAINSQKNLVLRKLCLRILKEEFQSGPFSDRTDQSMSHLLQQLADKDVDAALDEDLLKLVELILSRYGDKITHLKQILPLVIRIFHQLEQQVARGQIRLPVESCYAIFSASLDIPAFSEHSSQLVWNYIVLTQSIARIRMPQGLGECLLELYGKARRLIRNFPVRVLQLLMNFNWQFASMQIVNGFTDILGSADEPVFLNWLLEKQLEADFSIESCLLLHSIIYFQSQRLSPALIERLIAKIYRYRVHHRFGIDYINGKLSILLLMLIGSRSTVVYQLLAHEQWIIFAQTVKAERNTLVGRFNFTEADDVDYLHRPIQHQTFLDEILQFIYLDEHVYCWKYDVEVFLTLQLSLMEAQLHEPMQLKYANVAMVAILKNSLRAYYHTLNQEADESQPDSQDEELFPSKEIDSEFARHLRICKQYHVPRGLGGDYLDLLQKLIGRLQSNQSSSRWLKTIQEEVLGYSQKHLLQDLLNSERWGLQKLRRIYRVAGLKEDHHMELDPQSIQ